MPPENKANKRAVPGHCKKPSIKPRQLFEFLYALFDLLASHFDGA
jgi:hypothetical protein